MAPKGLKIGDTFDEKDFAGTFRHKVVGFDDQGNYISECLGNIDTQFGVVPFASTDGELVDDGSIEVDLPEEAEEQPAAEEPKEVKEVKKTTPKKKTTSTKKKTATKKK